MYKLLIVDDEPIALDGVLNCVDQTRLKIDQIYTASCVLEAKAIFKDNPVDILICDIEMPGENGFVLADWVKKNYPNTATLFLTCHAKFDYAKRALELGSFTYLLKPVTPQALTTELARTIGYLDKTKHMHHLQDMGVQYYRQISLISDKFWCDILNGNIANDEYNIRSYAQSHNIPLPPDGKSFLPVLVELQDWEHRISTEDFPTILFALRNLTSELICENLERAFTFLTAENHIVALVLCSNTPEYLEQKCLSLIEFCNIRLGIDICCYLANPIFLTDIRTCVAELKSRVANNIAFKNHVFSAQVIRSSNPDYVPLDMNLLKTMLSSNEYPSVIHKAQSHLREMAENGTLSGDTFRQFSQDYIQLIFVYCNDNGIQAHSLFHTKEAHSLLSETPKSLEELEQWTEKIMHIATDYIESVNNSDSAISKIKDYIELHLSEDITRADLAELVYLNPDYMNRLLKKETGKSITEYIMYRRLERARYLIEHTNMKISVIAQNVGYTNFSYFPKIFKRAYGLTPEEYKLSHNHTE